MTDRARLSKLPSYTSTNGADFLGSKDFPKALISSVYKWDPRGMLFGSSEINIQPLGSEQERLRQILDKKIKGKHVLVCSGGDDKLVPYHCSEPFMKFLKTATSSWYKGNVYVEDNVYPGVGHAYSEGMKKDASRFVCDILAGVSSRPISKM
jgi:precorrin-3B methylase